MINERSPVSTGAMSTGAIPTGETGPTTLVMFDIDGTLVRSGVLDDICYVETARDFLGDVPINTNWRGYHHVTNSGITADLYWEHLGQAPSAEQYGQFETAFAQAIAAYLDQNPQACEAIAGAAPFIQSLQQNPNIALAIATGGWSQCAKTKLNHAGIPLDGIPFASASDAIERVKIMELACDRALAHYNVSEFSQRIYIGDGVWDVAASSDLDYRFIGIGTGPAAQNLRDAGATEIYANFEAMDAAPLTRTMMA